MLPRMYPERRFLTRYAHKDLEYALALAAQAGIDAPGARLARERFERAIAAGDGDRYWPVIAEHIAREEAVVAACPRPSDVQVRAGFND